jgi:RHS repeat-associated protein
LQCWQYSGTECVQSHAHAGVYDAALTWRPDGRIGTVCVDADDDAACGSTATKTYVYDPAGELLGDGVGCALSSGLPTSACSETWAYDLQGNRTAHDPTAASGDSIAYFYDDAGRLDHSTVGSATTTYSYDDAGRRTGVDVPTGADTTLAYDPRGMPASITKGTTTILEMAYDGQGTLTDMTMGTADVPVAWDTTLAVPQIAQMLDTRAVWSTRRISSSNGSWLGYDWAGDFNQYITSTTVGTQYVYDPYGTADNGPTSLFYFSWGQRGELTLGDYTHLRHRLYDPATGTFLSPDPVMQDPYGTELGTPTEANTYHYVGNDPLNRTDPLGLADCKDDWWNPGGWVDCVAQVSPIEGQTAANFSGGVLNGLTFGHGEGLTEALGIEDNVDWGAAETHWGTFIGAALDVPFAWAESSVFGALLVASGGYNIWRDCFEGTQQDDCSMTVATSAVTIPAGGLGAFLSEPLANLVALLSSFLQIDPTEGVEHPQVRFALSCRAQIEQDLKTPFQ